MAAHALLLAHVERSQLQVGCLHVTESALDPRQSLVGPHHPLVRELLLGHLGAHRPQPVQSLLGRDGGCAALPAERVLADLDREVLLHATPLESLVDANGESVAAQRLVLALDGGQDLAQLGLGGVEQVLAALGAQNLQRGVATGDHALAGIGLGLEAAQLPGADLGGLQLAALDQGAQGRGAQGGDPAQALAGGQVLADALAGEHAAVAHEHDGGEAEAAAQGVALVGDGAGVGGVAGVDGGGDGAAEGIAQQADVDLQGAALAVAGVAAGSEGALVAGVPGGGEVVEGEAAGGEVAAGELVGDGLGALVEPVEGGVEVVCGDVAEGELAVELAHGGTALEQAGGLEARAGLEQAQHEERQGAVAEGGAAGVEQVGQAKPTGEAEGGGDMAGGTGLEDLEGVGGGADDDAALEEEGDLVDERGGELGDVREGGLEDLAAVPAGLADEDGGRGVAVGDALNIHGYDCSRVPAGSQARVIPYLG